MVENHEIQDNERERGGSVVEARQKRFKRPLIKPNAAKQLFDILVSNGHINQTRTNSSRSKNAPIEAKKEEQPENNIYRESDRMLNTFYSSLPQQPFTLSERELQLMHKIKAKNNQERFFEQVLAKRSIAMDHRDSLNKSEKSEDSPDGMR